MPGRVIYPVWWKYENVMLQFPVMNNSKGDFFVRNVAAYALVCFFFFRAIEILFLVKPLPFISFGIAFAGGFFLLIGYLRTLRNGGWLWSNNLTLMAGLVLAVWIATSAQLLSTRDLTDHLGRSSHDYLVKISVEICVWMFAGAALAYYRASRLDVIYSIFLFGLFALVLNASNFGFAIPYAELAARGEFKLLNHLLLSEYMLIMAYLAYFSVADRWRWLLIILIGYILFAGGGRTSFGFGMLSLFVYEFYYGSKLRALTAPLAGVLVLVALFAGLDQEVVTRMFLVGGVESDSSFLGRKQQFLIGLDGLAKQMAWGDLSVLVLGLGSLGAYMHNLFSVIQFYGIIVFILYVCVLVRAFQIAIRLFKAGLQEFFDKVFLALLIYSLFGVLFVKFVGFPTFWLAIGYWLFRNHLLRVV